MNEASEGIENASIQNFTKACYCLQKNLFINFTIKTLQEFLTTLSNVLTVGYDSQMKVNLYFSSIMLMEIIVQQEDEANVRSLGSQVLLLFDQLALDFINESEGVVNIDNNICIFIYTCILIR